MNSRKILIIGGVAAGMKTACRLRRLDANAEITVIDRTKNISYGACPLPYYIEGLYEDLMEVRKTPVGVLRDEAFFANVKGFTTLTRNEATAIDRDAKTVTIRSLDDDCVQTLNYDTLVMATGNTPIVPPVPGHDLDGVLPLKTMEHAQQLDTLADTAKNAVVVGGGLIGLEVAEALTKRGINVTLLEMKDQVMATALDFSSAAIVHRELRKNGVNLRLAEPLLRIEGQNRVEKVITDQGEYPADMVIMAIGVRPVTNLAKDAGIELGATGAIAVDDQMRTNDPAIFAVGDCVESIDQLTGKPVYVPLGSTANKHGRVAANVIAGQADRFPGILGSLVVKVFDLNVARTGLSAEDARLNGYDSVSLIATSPDIAHLYPGNKPIIIKLIADRQSRKLLGAQIVGPGVVDKRLDVVATAVTMGATVDQLAQFDLCYAPPFANAMDALIQAANAMRNKLDGLADSMSPCEAVDLVNSGEPVILLDVRSPAEHDEIRIPGATLLPLGALRKRLDELPKDQLIIPFCKLSLRGFEAQIILQQAGFTNVRYMEGGVLAWPYEFE
ncbi:FAD-dependent oxidoreductase [uncultured Desulfuromonas sp.]|uniref:FAD-dependent oxidoreductase n=1 Tax=uncultured Desulfuromonas sp. TaxID=181013 RepID=UPI002AAA7FC1|nr:FAD-dependent oxidoreductase [uncultured Desulfuromonas sp.]